MNTLRTILFSGTFLLMLLMNSCSSKRNFKNLAPIEFEAESIDVNTLLLDVRTIEEIQETGIINNAIHIDIYGDFVNDFQKLKLDTSQKVLIYCRSGSRSAKACGLIFDLGYTHLVNLKGGMNAWLENKMVIIK